MSETPTSLDYDTWQTYLDVCKADGTTPSVRDYLVWRDEQDDKCQHENVTDGGYFVICDNCATEVPKG